MDFLGQSELKKQQSPPANGIPIIFTISRMNPPTPGHLELIRKLIEKAVEVNAPTVYVILSKSVDNSDNPIVCPSKIDVLNEMVAHLKRTMAQQYPQINNIQVVFKCVDPNENSPISTISNMVYQYDENTRRSLYLFLIVGDDRADLLNTMNKLFGKIGCSVEGQILEREEMESYKNLCVNELNELTISDVPISAFSASFVRKLVKNGLRDQFNDVYRDYLSPELIDKLYTEIQEGFAKVMPTKTAKRKRTEGGKRKANTRKKLKKAKRYTRKGNKRHTRKHG
jgi:nicotinic acid mononucleotide adenylyltransferase